MKTEKINLSDDGRVFIVSYVLDESNEIATSHKRPVMLVCPGGGYFFTSDREAEPVALSFASYGYNTYILRYSVHPYAAFPNSLVDLCHAMKYIREHADEDRSDPDKIAVVGFSAGGHLAASLGVYWNDPEIQEKAGTPGDTAKPNALLLCYPVITSEMCTHAGTIQALLNGTEGEERKALAEKVSLEKHVGKQTPPCFLMSTFYDNAVPIENTLKFADALAAANVPFELHIVQDGDHGLARGDDTTYFNTSNLNSSFAKWPELARHWLGSLFETAPGTEPVFPSALKRERPTPWVGTEKNW